MDTDGVGGQDVEHNAVADEFAERRDEREEDEKRTPKEEYKAENTGTMIMSEGGVKMVRVRKKGTGQRKAERKWVRGGRGRRGRIGESRKDKGEQRDVPTKKRRGWKNNGGRSQKDVDESERHRGGLAALKSDPPFS